MRTVSFSSAPVQKMLKSDFVCSTINIDGDPTAGASLAHAPTDSCGSSSRGIGRPNVQTLFLSPAGEILHVASGYVGPKDMAKEIRFAKKLHDATKKSPENAKTIVANLHANRLKELGFNKADIESRGNRSLARDIRKRVLGGVFPTGQFPRGRMSPQQMRNWVTQRRNALRNGPTRPRARPANTRRRTPLVRNRGAGDDFHASRNSGIFASFGHRAVLGDHQFSIDKPLYPMSDFLENPRVLIGNEQTAYGSVGPGGASGGTIGGNGNTRFQSGTPSVSFGP